MDYKSMDIGVQGVVISLLPRPTARKPSKRTHPETQTYSQPSYLQIHRVFLPSLEAIARAADQTFVLGFRGGLNKLFRYTQQQLMKGEWKRLNLAGKHRVNCFALAFLLVMISVRLIKSNWKAFKLVRKHQVTCFALTFLLVSINVQYLERQ